MNRLLPLVCVITFGYFFVLQPFQDFWNAIERNAKYRFCFDRLEKHEQLNPEKPCGYYVPISFQSVLWFVLYVLIFAESICYLFGQQSLLFRATGYNGKDVQGCRHCNKTKR